MKLAAIDIGSNAARIQIVRVIEDKSKKQVSFKKIEYLRYPLRLGKSVFSQGKITNSAASKFLKLMETFSLLMDLHEVEHYEAVATSAMREASNGDDLVEKIYDKTNIKIQIISGHEEARLLSIAMKSFILNSQMLHIDVGGGSTELNFYKNKERTASKSFKIGTVRSFLGKKDAKELFEKVTSWFKKLDIDKKTNIVAIGTGGNINKLSKLSISPDSNSLSLVELKALRAFINEYSYEDKMSKLKMNADRADVIVPACNIYIKVMESCGADRMFIPKVGLKDGVIIHLYHNASAHDVHDYKVLEI